LKAIVGRHIRLCDERFVNRVGDAAEVLG